MKPLPERQAILPPGIGVLCLFVMLVSGCNRDASVKAEGTDPSKVQVEEAPDVNILEVDHPEEFKLVTVGQRPVVSEMSVNGVVAPDVTRSVPVLSLAAGRAIEINARLGDHVEKGQVLVRINSPDVSNAISVYQQAVADNTLARKQLERSQTLLDKGAIAAKDLEVAQDAADKAQVTLNTSERQLRLLGGDPAHPSPIIDLRAPTSGWIVEQNVVAGAAIKSTDSSPNLFTIADLSSVWAVCDVYENNLAQVHLGDPAEVRLNAYPDRVFRGTVSNILTVLDPNTRSAKVRIVLENPSGLLRVGMFAVATFQSQTRRLTCFVPATAILRLHDRDWVFMPAGGNRFRRAEVQGGPVSADGMQEVLSGLSPGTQVVAAALQFSSASTKQ